jgi:acyl-CoA thioesterase
VTAPIVSRSSTDPPIAISQVPRSKNSSISPMSSAAAIAPPIRAPRIPIAVVPMQPPGPAPGVIARAIAPANSPRRIQPRIPTARTVSIALSIGWRAAMSFDSDLELVPDGDGAWSARISEDWWTPRGPLGGYVMALGLRAMEEAVADPERMPRSATMHFLRSPEPGEIALSAAVERRGRSLSSVSSRLEQDGKLIGLALGAYSKPWEGPLLDDAAMPEVEPPDESVPRATRPGAPNPPPFLDRMDMQPRFGAAPFTGAEEAKIGGWLGLREERPLDAATVAILADAWFPAPWTRLRALAPAPTIDLTIHFRAALPLDGRLLLGRFQSKLVRDGFFEEDGELWARDGTLVAQSRQLGLLLGAEV